MTEGLGDQASPASLHGDLEQDRLIFALDCFNFGKPDITEKLLTGA